MRKRISESIGLKYFINMMSLLVICCTVIYTLVVFFLPKNYQAELESQFTAEFQNLVWELEANGYEGISDKITGFSINNNASVEITDEEGKRTFLIKADVEYASESDRKLSAAAQFQYGNQTYTISSSADFIAVDQSYDVLLRLVPLIGVMILIISAVGACISAHSFSKPLIAICSVAERMSNLDMTWQCDASRSDEIGVLAGSLNEMSSKLSDALDNLQKANMQLQQDIEKERCREKQRIELFTSLSHELKTPITIIKGELEGMIYQVGDYKDRDTYLRHSLKTVNNMEKLVKQILIAAQMGDNELEVLKSDLNLTALLKKCCRNVQGIAEDKEIEINLNLEPDIRYSGDEQLLRRAFLNIVENAVLYSPGMQKIFVRLDRNSLCVENTGVHIAEGDLEQIFHPFYRSDKSRSRNTGGSGLGLYIAKSIFDHHDMICHVENTEKGVKFIVIWQ